MLLKHRGICHLNPEVLNVLQPSQLSDISKDLAEIVRRQNLRSCSHLLQQLTPHIHQGEPINRKRAVYGNEVIKALNVLGRDLKKLLCSRLHPKIPSDPELLRSIHELLRLLKQKLAHVGEAGAGEEFRIRLQSVDAKR